MEWRSDNRCWIVTCGRWTHLQTHLSLFNCRVMIRAATGAKREIYCRSICLAFTVDIITANVSPLWKSSRPRRSILRQFYCHRRHQGPLRPETYSPSLKFSAPNMLGNPFYGAHLKTNGRWHQILNPVSSDTAPPTCLWTLVQMSLGKRVERGGG